MCYFLFVVFYSYVAQATTLTLIIFHLFCRLHALFSSACRFVREMDCFFFSLSFCLVPFMSLHMSNDIWQQVNFFFQLYHIVRFMVKSNQRKFVIISTQPLLSKWWHDEVMNFEIKLLKENWQNKYFQAWTFDYYVLLSLRSFLLISALCYLKGLKLLTCIDEVFLLQNWCQ